jgi:imidazolonepropionase-like amidohydrolase
MRRRLLATACVCFAFVTIQAAVQTSNIILLEGAWLFSADGTTPIDDSAILIEGDRVSAVSRRGTVRAPSGAVRVDLSGKFVIPAFIDAHSHPGYTDIAVMTTSAANYTRDTVTDHLRRYAYYGVASTLSLGLDRGELPFRIRDERIEGAALFHTAGRGIAGPNAGPNAQYWRDAPYGVTTEVGARAAVRELASRNVRIVKIWVDDRGGTVPKLPRALYQPIIDEAHQLGRRVVAHVFYLADAKELLRAGIDGFAHGIRDLEVDDEFVALFRGRPQVFLLPNLPDGVPSDDELSWLSETLPPGQIARMRQQPRARSENAQRLFDRQLRNLRTLTAAGVRIGLGTDAGATLDGTTFGWSVHTELADMVAAGLTPAHAIIAATRTSAEILEQQESGTIAAGKSADFIVLDANPLEDIRNTRRISAVYLRGRAVDRAALRRAFNGGAR